MARSLATSRRVALLQCHPRVLYAGTGYNQWPDGDRGIGGQLWRQQSRQRSMIGLAIRLWYLSEKCLCRLNCHLDLADIHTSFSLTVTVRCREPSGAPHLQQWHAQKSPYLGMMSPACNKSGSRGIELRFLRNPYRRRLVSWGDLGWQCQIRV